MIFVVSSLHINLPVFLRFREVKFGIFYRRGWWRWGIIVYLVRNMRGWVAGVWLEGADNSTLLWSFGLLGYRLRFGILFSWLRWEKAHFGEGWELLLRDKNAILNTS